MYIVCLASVMYVFVWSACYMSWVVFPSFLLLVFAHVFPGSNDSCIHRTVNDHREPSSKTCIEPIPAADYRLTLLQKLLVAHSHTLYTSTSYVVQIDEEDIV